MKVNSAAAARNGARPGPVLLVAALSLGLVGLPAQPVLAQAELRMTQEEARDQGVLYFKRGHFKRAKAQLDRAFKMKGGDQDFRTVYYRAQAAYKLLLLEQAFEMAHRAEKLAGDDGRKKRAVGDLLSEMNSLYGKVTFVRAKGETASKEETKKSGRIFFEAQTGIINKAKKQRFLSIRERFRNTDVTLPTTVYLPYGDYLANKVPFTLEQGAEPPTVEIFLVGIEGEDGEDDGMLWWWVGIGGAAAVAAGVGAFFLFSPDDAERPLQTRIISVEGQR